MTASRSIEHLGDGAVRITIGSAAEGRARARALRASGAVDDAWHTETALAFTPRAGADVATLAAIAGDAGAVEPREHSLAVVLDGADVDDVAAAAGVGRGELERLVFDAVLEVSFLGFSPGFGYLRGIDRRLHLPRRASPRPRVAAGSLAVAGGFAAIYPGATAGGWHLLGRALEPLWQDGEPRLAAGDRVRFVPGDPGAAAPRSLATAPAPAHAIVIEDVRGLAFVQDGGRAGRLHHGMPPAGALVPSALAIANRAVGNAAGAPGLERYGALRVGATVATTIATDDGAVHALGAGASIELPWPAIARAGYVAIAGGLDVPLVLDGRGTHVRAQLGGLDGRPLRRGDRIGLGARPFDSAVADAPAALRANGGGRPETETGTETGTVIRLIAGPDVDRFAPDAIDRLVSTTWHLSHRSDRMGTRLEGPALLHRADAPATTAPLVLGAIEVPSDGLPIVLGPEHPTTGGYPVIAVVAAADLDAFHRRPLGRPVRFRIT